MGIANPTLKPLVGEENLSVSVVLDRSLVSLATLISWLWSSPNQEDSGLRSIHLEHHLDLLMSVIQNRSEI